MRVSIAIAGLAALVLTSTAFAASADFDEVVRCSFQQDPSIVRGGEVNAVIKARDLEQGTNYVAKCRTAKGLVRKAISKGPTKKRFIRAGFNCKPTLLNPGGLKIRWKCTYRGADNPTYSRVTFKLKLSS